MSQVADKVANESAATGTSGARNVSYNRFANGKWSDVSASVPSELPLTIYVNGEELVSILCTPLKLNCLVTGFLYSENIIDSVDEVVSMRVCPEDSLAEVRLSKPEFTLPRRFTLTSGCGGGVSLATEGKEIPKINSDLVVTPEEIFPLMKYLYKGAELYRQSGGLHTSALSDKKELLVVSEDIGRHNTLDKIQGECLLMGIPTRDRLLLTTGRISSEMLMKAARMAVPIIISRTSATDRAISLALELGITLIGYARSHQLVAYSHQERVHT